MQKDIASPQSIYLQPSDLEGYVQNLKGENIKADNIRKHLEALKKKDNVVYDPSWGYQHEDFKNMPPNFTKTNDN